MTATHTLPGSVCEAMLYVAFELGTKTWRLGLTSGFGVEPWIKSVAAGDWPTVRRVLAQAKRRFGLPATALSVSCYEAGRDGFWIHRALGREGIRNRVVDSASIEVKRRQRRAKTDRLDARKLVAMLVRACLGEREVWREVRVPTEIEEATRHVSRERTQLVQERTRVTNQLRSWLATWGARLPARRTARWWEAVKDWAGAPLPRDVQARLARADERLALLTTQLGTLTDGQRQAAAPADRDRGACSQAGDCALAVRDDGRDPDRCRAEKRVGSSATCASRGNGVTQRAWCL